MSEIVRNKVLDDPILFSGERDFLRNHLAQDFLVDELM